MKVEIKKIGISTVLFSVLVMMLSALMEVFNPEAVINAAYIMGLIMRAIQSTLLFLVSTVFFLLAYNLLCAVGIRGVRVELEDK